MRWLVDTNGDLVNVDQITRITTAGSDPEWAVMAKMIIGSDVTISSGHSTRGDAQQVVRDLIDSIGE